MFKRKPKVLTPKEMEEIRTKDFFDCIRPGTIKFLSDHYILGDNYCCVWAVAYTHLAYCCPNGCLQRKYRARQMQRTWS